MATRYAGDYFGVVLDGSDTSSELLKYFPGLRSVAKTPQVEKEPAARTKGGYSAPTEFAGFKLLEASNKKA